MGQQTAFFRSKTRKNKTGEVSVIRHKNGFRTLSVTGKVKIPSFFSNYPKVLHSTITEVGSLLLGLFPFLAQGKDKRICTFSLPETTVRRNAHINLTYDFLYTISGVDIPTETILQTLLTRNEVIGEFILDKLGKEMEDVCLDGG